MSGNNPAFDLIGLTALRDDPEFSGIDGSGFSVAVIDTGLDRDHPLLSPNYITGVDFINGGDNPIDKLSHGTHVAGTVGAADEDIGVAPDVGLIGLKVFPDEGGAPFTAIEAALQWVQEHQAEYKITAVNMSLGGGFFTSEADARSIIIYDEVKRLEQAGVTVVSAGGNDYKNNEYPNFGAPAIFSTLGVGAVWQDGRESSAQWGSGAVDNSTGADRLTSFTQRLDSDHTIFAPGALITSTVPQGGLERMGGTSMASPIVAGAVALMQEAAVQFGGRTLAPSEIVDIMRSTADNIYDGDDEDDNVENTENNYPRLNIYRAIDAIKDRFGDIAPGGDANGTIAGAIIGPILDGSPVNPILGSIGIDGNDNSVGDRDVDIISFEVVSSGDVEINLGSNQDDREDFDSYLRLFDERGREIASDNNDGADKFSRLEVSLESGVYYVGISGNDNVNYDPNEAGTAESGATGNYSLEFSLSNDDPNGLISGAVPVNLAVDNSGDAVFFEGFLGSDYEIPVGQADVDIFALTIPDNGVLLADIDTPLETDYADTYLRVFDNEGNELVSSDDDLATDISGNPVEFTDNFFPNLIFDDPNDRDFFSGHLSDSFITAEVEAGEIYYVAISDYFNQDYNPNNLNNRSDRGEGGLYNLTLSFANPDLNGSIPQAVTDFSLPLVDIPGTIGADLGQRVGDRDVDFFLVNSSDPGILQVDVQAYAIGLEDPVDAVVLLFDSDGNRLAVNDDRALGEADPLLQYAIDSNQDYYLAIAGYGNENFNPFQLGSGAPGVTGDYVINATVLPNTDSQGLSDNSVDNGAIAELELDSLIFANIGFDNNFRVGDADIDIYSFTPATDAIITISTNTNDPFSADTFLRFFDNNGKELAYNDDINSSTRASLIQIPVQADESYLIGINGYSENARDYDPITGNDAPFSTSTGSYGVLLTEENNNLTGTNRADTLKGTKASEVIDGKKGNDEITADKGNDLLIGGLGDDLLSGEKGNDLISGGKGDDLLIGGPGLDRLEGGSDRDKFQFKNLDGDRDIITDFKPKSDLITVSSSGFGDGLATGTIEENQFLIVSNFNNLDDDFSLGFIYHRTKGILAYIDTENDINLTEIALLERQPPLNFENIQVLN